MDPVEKIRAEKPSYISQHSQSNPFKALGILAIVVVIGIMWLMHELGKQDPGPLGGTWADVNMPAIPITFRKGEVITMGVIERVEYEKSGNEVIVNYLEGIAKGTRQYFKVNGNYAETGISKIKKINSSNRTN